MLALFLFSWNGLDRAHDSADIDTVTLNENLVIQNQSIGVASSAQGFNDVDGIIGWVLCPRN